MPSGWEWARLQNVCSYIQRGKSPVYSEIKKYPAIAQKCNQWSGLFIEKAQFVAPDTVIKYSEDRILQDKDLLWNSTGLGTLGRMAVYRSKLNPYGWAVADSHVTVIRPIQEMAESLFFYLFFASPTVQSVIEDKAEGSTKQKELYVDTVKEYLIPVPPYKEQKRIVAKIEEVLPEVLKYGKSQERLDKLNEGINERLRKSILQEAIQGKLVPQILPEVPASSLLEQIRIEKQKLLKEGKLKKKDIVDSVIYKGEDNKYYEKVDGKVLDISDEIPFEIPDSWQWSRLKNIAQILNGYAFKSNNYKPSGYRVIRITNVQDGYIVDNDPKFYSSIVEEGLQEYIINKGDLLMSLTGNVGRVGIITEEFLPAVLNQRVANIRLIPYGVLLQYLFSFFKTPHFVNAAISNSKGMAQKNMSTEWLKECLVPIPPINEQHRIFDRIQSLKLCPLPPKTEHLIAIEN